MKKRLTYSPKLWNKVSVAKGTEIKGEKMDSAKKNRKLEQLIESVRNQLESTKYTKGVVIKPKDEVIYDRCMFAQLLKEKGRFGAEWISWFGVFVVPDYEESSSKARQESPQDKTIETVKRSRV